MSKPIYILCPSQTYEQMKAQPAYTSESLESEGFIHASPADQLTRVANKYYSNEPELQLLTIEPERVTSEIRNETIANGDIYPHIYGPLNWDAIVRTDRVERSMDGNYDIYPPD